MTNPEFTDFENIVNQEILLWSQQNPEAIKKCNGKQDVAKIFWEQKLKTMYGDTSNE